MKGFFGGMKKKLVPALCGMGMMMSQMTTTCFAAGTGTSAVTQPLDNLKTLVIAVIGAVGLVFSLYKAVRSFFSSDYKKEQQRKSADENIEKVFEKLTEMLDGNLESAIAKINEALISTKTQMRIPYEQSLNTKVALEEIAVKMASLRDKLVSKPASTAAPTPTTEAAIA